MKRLETRAGFVRVRGAREHNLKNVDVEIPRDAFVVFTGVSGSGKSSLAFGTLYGEAQRRYLESVSPYARRLFDQMPVPEVDDIDGLPPAVALQQQRGTPTARSSVGSVTTLSNLLRMLYSRAGDYRRGQPLLYASFSPNTPEGACPACSGLGRVYEVTEASMVPDASKTIRERAVAAWPQAWGGQNLRDILVTLGYDVDKPWRELPKKQRDWILFTDEQPQVPVYAGVDPATARRLLERKAEPSYLGTFSSARRHVMHTFATTHSARMKARVAQYMLSGECKACGGKRLRPEPLSVTFAGYDITELSRLSLEELAAVFAPKLRAAAAGDDAQHVVIQRIAFDLHVRAARRAARARPRLPDARAQHADAVAGRAAAPAARDPGALEPVRRRLRPRRAVGRAAYRRHRGVARGARSPEGAGQLAVRRRARARRDPPGADWIVDLGPMRGERGGEVLYSGPPAGLAHVAASRTRPYLFEQPPLPARTPRARTGVLRLEGITRNNLDHLDVELPLGVLTTVTGVSGSGKSSLVSQALVELVSAALGDELAADDDDAADALLADAPAAPTGGRVTAGMDQIKRLVRVDQRPIGRTPRSNLATYTGLFDHVRQLFASTPAARARKYDAGRFSFNVAKGRCPNCEGEGSVFVEMLFLPSVYAPCPVCGGKRYNAKTLEITYHDRTIADVLALTVDAACAFFADEPAVARALQVVREVGLGYVRLGQPATELSGGEAQRIKLAAELQRPPRGGTLYILDEPTTGLHPADVDTLTRQLDGLVAAGNTVIVVEHDLRVIAASDWIIDVGPGAGARGGTVVAQGTAAEVARDARSRTAPYLAATLAECGPRTASARARR